MSSESALDAFISRQRKLLVDERAAEIERSSLLLSNCGPKLLEQKGLALNGLGVASMNIGLGGKTLVELERPSAYHTSPSFPPHTLRPGDLARIEAHVTAPGGSSAKKAKKATSTTSETKPVEGVVYRVSDARIVVALDSSDTSDDTDLPERCRVVKIANSVTYDRMDKAIDALEKTIKGANTDDKNVPQLTPLVQVLMAMKEVSNLVPVPPIEFFDANLNESQRDAIKFCLESPEVACIHGPPGTGKTHTLIELIRQLTKTSPNEKPKRILVCGASNLSVDNILERLLAIPSEGKAEKLKVTRIGHPARVMATQNILDSTLEVQASQTDQAALAKDVQTELETTMAILSGTGKGAKGKRPKGAERRKLWDEVKALRKEYRKREGGVVESVVGDAQVILATCHSAGGRQIRRHDFDVVIIDEATQSMEAVCWVPIFKAKKLILAGDPKQLPPTVLSLDKKKKLKQKHAVKEKSTPKNTSMPSAKAGISKDQKDEDDVDSDSSGDATDEGAEKKPVVPPSKQRVPLLVSPRSLETTLFERLEKMYGNRIKRMLNVQYRMHAKICEFPSRTLYGNKLESHESVAEHLLSDIVEAKGADEETIKEMLEMPVVFFDTAGCEYFERTDGDGDEGSKCNENEAMVVKSYVDKLVEVGLEPSQIAIISPYQAQVTLLNSLLRPQHGPKLEIGTVDGMQGREKDAVIISMVRSNDKREVGFLKEKRRLNVAMTRARRHLCVVGDSSTVKHGGSYLKSWLNWLEANADLRYGGLE